MMGMKTVGNDAQLEGPRFEAREAEDRSRRPKVGGGVIGEGQRSPPNQLGGLG